MLVAVGVSQTKDAKGRITSDIAQGMFRFVEVTKLAGIVLRNLRHGHPKGQEFGQITHAPRLT